MPTHVTREEISHVHVRAKLASAGSIRN